MQGAPDRRADLGRLSVLSGVPLPCQPAPPGHAATAPDQQRHDENGSFHDGSPFNAEAAAFGLNHVLDPDNAFPMRTFLGPELTATAVDEYTLDVTTEAPDPILPTRLYFVTIPSMKALQENPDDWDSHPVGTGPYKFVAWNRGQSIELE